jgi:hypothetical protein
MGVGSGSEGKGGKERQQIAAQDQGAPAEFAGL